MLLLEKGPEIAEFANLGSSDTVDSIMSAFKVAAKGTHHLLYTSLCMLYEEAAKVVLSQAVMKHLQKCSFSFRTRIVALNWY